MKKLSITIILLLALVFFLPYSVSKSFRDYARLSFAPVFKATTKVSAVIRYPIDWLKEIGDLRKENTDLKIRLASLANQVIAFETFKSENKNLRAELELRPKISGFRRIVATVVSRSTPGSSSKLILDQGGLSGIAEGDAVLAAGSLIGKITNVLPHSSTVTLLISADLLIQARISQTGEKGLVSGRLSGIYLSDLPTNTKLKAGLIVETSGLGGTMPAGVFIGETTEQKSSEADPETSVRIRSLIDFHNLETVFVLVRES